MGDVTFFHRNGKCFWRKKSVHPYPGTPAQLRHLSLHQRALASWRSLGSADQEVWREYARCVPAHRPPFLNENHISGYNLFVSAYHGFAALGNEHVPEARPFEPFPVFSVVYDDVEKIDDANIIVRLDLNVSARYRLLAKVQIVSPKEGVRPCMMRNHLGEGSGDGKVSLSLVLPDNLVGASAVKLNMRCLLIDSLTGYRSQYQKMSIVIAL